VFARVLRLNPSAIDAIADSPRSRYNWFMPRRPV
jgi:hypothetical protein